MAAPTRNVFAETRLWIAVLVVGVAVAVPGWLAGRLAGARAAGAEEATRAAAQDRRLLLLRLDHELKNPVTANQAGLANLLPVPHPSLAAKAASGTAPGNDASAGRAVESIAAQARRLTELVADLRKLAELLDEVNEAIGELPAPGTRTSPSACPRRPGPWERSPTTGTCCSWPCTTCWSPR